MMGASVLVVFSQLLLHPSPLILVADTNYGDYDENTKNGSHNSPNHIGGVDAVVKVAVSILLNAIRIPLRTIPIKIAAAAGTILIFAMRIVGHYSL
jgi:hypothetical protein